jgi:hypothetical protein
LAQSVRLSRKVSQPRPDGRNVWQKGLPVIPGLPELPPHQSTPSAPPPRDNLAGEINS